MCRSTSEGYRRCKSGARGKIAESYQKALYYRAKKSGKTINQWITDNPEDAKVLQGKRDAQLARTETMIKNQEALFAPDEIRTIDPRVTFLNDCLKESQKELSNLTADERHAIRGYTGISYQTVNKALLGIGGFSTDDEEPERWRDRDLVGGIFKNLDDAADYVNELDNALKERHHEERVTYRGIVGQGISNILNDISGTKQYTNEYGSGGYVFNPEEKVHATKMLVEHYKEGTQVKFDSYVSTSLNPSTGVDWSYRDNNSVGIIYEIKSNAGKNISIASSSRREREVLLPRGLNFKVVSSYVVEEYKYQHPDSKGTIVERSTAAVKNGFVVVQLIEVDDTGNEIDAEVREYIPAKKIDTQTLEAEESNRIQKALDEDNEK